MCDETNQLSDQSEKENILVFSSKLGLSEKVLWLSFLSPFRFFIFHRELPAGDLLASPCTVHVFRLLCAAVNPVPVKHQTTLRSAGNLLLQRGDRRERGGKMFGARLSER